MKVSIRYPDEFPLTGWDKSMFGLRVAGMFRSKYICICTLDACRKQLKLECERKTQLSSDLHELHCVSFREIPVDILDELPSKVSEYLGVEVRRSYKVSLIPTTGFLVTALLITVLAVDALMYFPLFKALKHERLERTITQPPILLSSTQPSEVVPPSLEGNYEAPKIFEATVTTSSPAKAIRQLANAITTNGKQFDVVITVTRSGD